MNCEHKQLNGTAWCNENTQINHGIDWWNLDTQISVK